MRQLTSILCIIGILLSPLPVGATPTGFSGGVNDEYEYEEIVFVTGEPIKFIGGYKIAERIKPGQKTLTYTFKLKPVDKTITGSLDRQMSYEISFDTKDDEGQTITQTDIAKLKETITLGKDKYVLQDFQFSKSDIIDNRPVADYYSGNFKGRKYYDINRTEGKATVEITGGNVGYENFWGNTETQILDYIIDVDRITTDGIDLSWQGTVNVQVSDSMTKTMQYSPNDVNLSSFNGGHMRITNREMVAKYSYQLPTINEGIPENNNRNIGSMYLTRQMVPRIERLMVPKFRDIGGHWSEENIQKLYSLDVFDEVTNFFTPDVPMTRIEFTKAVMKACNIRVTTGVETSRSSRNKVTEISPFADVKVEDENYQYVKDALKKGIVLGVTEELFKPNDFLTRAQAITILVRALGFEHKAPAPDYITMFSDDHLIPNWAKDSIYVARELGLTYGDAFNRVNPGLMVTRAEASALLVRFLNFLEQDLQKDYRENILMFN